MSQNTNPLSTSEPWNLVADGYAETTMLMFEQYADVAIAASKFKPNSTKKTQLGSHPHDVNPHPQPFSQKEKGAKSLSRRERGWGEGTPATSLPQREIEQTGHRNIKLHCGDAQTLPYRDATFDAAFSLFGLMFFPDRQRGFAEIYRTLKPGGSIANTSWAPVDQSPAMMAMFGALRAIKPDLPQPQRSVTTLKNPTKILLQAVKRNLERFPEDFMFQLNAEEWKDLRSQIVTSNDKPAAGRKNRLDGDATRFICAQYTGSTQAGVRCHPGVDDPARANEETAYRIYHR